jgi:hypothetical protein
MSKWLRLAAACFVPHSLVMLRDQLRVHRWREQQRILERERRRRVRTAVSCQVSNGKPWFDYQEALAYLESRGCDALQVREGSMPKLSLEFCQDRIAKSVRCRPVLGLHIGNFVGVSLAYFAWVVRQMDECSLILSIDPNIPHRGIFNPLQHAIGLLNFFGLQRNALVLTGYSLEKSISNDGINFGDYDPVREYTQELSCENQLHLLAQVVRRVDFCVIDGNHDPEYLLREVHCVDSMLADGGLLILDDVDWRFAEIEDIFHKHGNIGYTTVGADGRVGILRKPEAAR